VAKRLIGSGCRLDRVMSGVNRGMNVLDGSTCRRERGGFPPSMRMAFLTVFLKQKCIRLVRRKLAIFPSAKSLFILLSQCILCYEIEVDI